MKIINKRASFDYELFGRYEAGIVLSGIEAKSARDGHVNITNSHAKVISGEVFLINAHINSGAQNEVSSSRSRKLLLHRSEILEIEAKMKAKKLTLVPCLMYTKARLIKVELRLAKSKRKFEKRASLKEKDIKKKMRSKSTESF